VFPILAHLDSKSRVSVVTMDEADETLPIGFPGPRFSPLKALYTFLTAGHCV